MAKKLEAVILGGGVAGLAAGWMLARTGRYQVTVLERAPVTGGMCGTFSHDNFLLDYGPHKSYSAIPGIMDELTALMGDEFIRHEKRNSIYLFESFLNYPLSMLQLAGRMGPKNLVACGFSTMGAITKGFFNGHEPASYEDYVVARFGGKLYELVFEPLAGKIWGDPATLSADIAKTRIPSTSIIDVAARMLGLKKENALTDAKYFYYPRDGFGRIPARMAEEIKKHNGRIVTGTNIRKATRRGHHIESVTHANNGHEEQLPCDLLISSIPLDGLVNLLDSADTQELQEAAVAARRLQYRGVILVYLVLNRPQVTEEHWIFFPGREFVFGRIFEQKNLSEAMGPNGQTVICCDFTDAENGPLWKLDDAALAKKCTTDLAKAGIIEPGWVVETFVKRFPKFYPRYDLNYRQTIGTLYESLKRFDNLLPTGRVGFYNYNNSDHCVDMAKFITENLLVEKSTDEIWTALEQRVADYRIVD
jgi:protoporphyrinogen oxidase